MSITLETMSANNPFQFDSIIDFMQMFPDDKACKAHFAKIRWNGEPVCPVCASKNVYERKQGHNYVCRECRRNFTVKTGTIFEQSNLSMLKWYLAMYFISTNVKGISSCQLAKKIKVTQKSAWFMLHRIRFAFAAKSFSAPVKGVVELDETYVGGKEKNKHEDKKTPNTQGRCTVTKVPVFGIKSETDGVFATVVPNVQKDTLQEIVKENVAKGSIVKTDEYQAFKGLEKEYDHRVCNHGKKDFVTGWDTHTNGMENYWSHLKRMIIGTYHQISRKHMNQYLGAQSFRYNNCKNQDWEKFTASVYLSDGKRLTYKQLIAE